MLLRWLLCVSSLAQGMAWDADFKVRLLESELPYAWFFQQKDFTENAKRLLVAAHKPQFFKITLPALTMDLIAVSLENPYVKLTIIPKYSVMRIANGLNTNTPHTPHLLYYFYTAALEHQIVTTLFAKDSFDPIRDVAPMVYLFEGLKKHFELEFPKSHWQRINMVTEAGQRGDWNALQQHLPTINHIFHLKYDEILPYITAEMLTDMYEILERAGVFP